MRRLMLLSASLAVLLAPAAQAYIGPGAGISVLGGIISVIVGVFVAIGAVVLWPLRRAMKRRKAARAGTTAADGERAGAPPEA